MKDDFSTSTYSSITTLSCPVIEEHASSTVNNNLYYVTKSQDDKRRQKNSDTGMI